MILSTKEKRLIRNKICYDKTFVPLFHYICQGYHDNEMKWFVNARLELIFHNMSSPCVTCKSYENKKTINQSMSEKKMIPTEQALVLDTFERLNSSFIICRGGGLSLNLLHKVAFCLCRILFTLRSHDQHNL